MLSEIWRTFVAVKVIQTSVKLRGQGGGGAADVRGVRHQGRQGPGHLPGEPANHCGCLSGGVLLVQVPRLLLPSHQLGGWPGQNLHVSGGDLGLVCQHPLPGRGRGQKHWHQAFRLVEVGQTKLSGTRSRFADYPGIKFISLQSTTLESKIKERKVKCVRTTFYNKKNKDIQLIILPLIFNWG